MNMNKKDYGKFAMTAALLAIDVIFTVCLVCDVIQSKSLGENLLGIILLLLCYAVTVAAILIERHLSAKRTKEEASMLNNVTLDFIQNLELPVLISDEDGNTVWFNDILGTVSKESNGIEYGDNISSLSAGKVTAADLKKGGKTDMDIGGIHYSVSSYNVGLYNKSHIVSVFFDRTFIDSLENEIKMKNPVVSFIVVDNLGDLYSNFQDKNRDASDKIAGILNRMASEMNAVIKEYERDRYMLVYEYKYLLGLIERKFDILDEIREATVEDDTNVPVTISIGTACDEQSFAEKAESAKQALELALQRGGDQSVVKYSQSVEMYGGKSKSVQKRSKLRSRVIASELEMRMKKCKNVLIMGHKYADHDAIGASVGIARMAMHCGARANIVCDLEDKNYRAIASRIARLPEYSGFFIDAPTALELLDADTLVIAVDVNNVQLMEEPQLFLNAENTVVIDHHRKSGEFERQPVIAYIEPSVSSACEIVSEMLEQFLPSGELAKEEADLILSGIWLDTKQFSKNAGVRTFGAAQYLRGEGATPSETAALFKSSLEEVTGEAKFESKVVIYLDTIAISALDSEGEANDKIAASKAADKFLTIKDITASFVLYRVGSQIHISARSAGSINVQLILEKMNGGGHFDMAGAQVESTDMVSVLHTLKACIDEYLQTQHDSSGGKK